MDEDTKKTFNKISRILTLFYTINKECCKDKMIEKHLKTILDEIKSLDLLIS